MGDKGTTKGAAARVAAASLQEDLEPWGDITSKGMFGGYGLFKDGVMFAIVDPGGQCFLRGDDASAEEFESSDSERHGRMPYWTIPASVRDDGARLLEWARAAHHRAVAAKR